MKKISTFLFMLTIAITMFAQVAPTFQKEAGTYYNPFSVEITGNDIYYTLDGTTPTTESTKYTAAISIDEFGKSTTITAASYTNGKWSDVVTATYELKVAAPIFSIGSGVYEKITGNIALKLTTETTGATIHYNDRGGDPKSAGSKQYGALSILSTKSVKAVAFITDAKGQKIYSDIVSEYYVISPIALFETAKEVIGNNKYIMNCDKKAASSLYEIVENGNLNAIEITNSKGKYIETNEFNHFLFTATDGGYNIQDAYGRYIYLNDNDGFNASKTKPATGAVWSVSIENATSLATITNVATGKIIAYDTQENIFGAYTNITASMMLPKLCQATEYPTIIITPEDGDTLNEFSKFTVKCEKGLKYKETNKLYTYYNIGYDYTKREFDNIEQIDENTYEFTLDEPIKSSDDYKIVFPAGVFTLAPNELAKTNSEIIARYTVASKDILEITLANPENKEITKSLQYLYFEFNQDIVANVQDAVITDRKGNKYPLTKSKIDSWGDPCLDNALCLMTDVAITASGEYTFVLKKEYICAKEETSLSIEKDMTFIFTVEESLKINSITPNNSDIYDSVDEIIFTFNKAAMHNNITEIIVTDSNNKRYTFTKTTTEEETSSLRFKTTTPITNAGTYTFTIDGSAIYHENANSDMNEIETITETSFTFIVKNPTSVENVNAENGKKDIYDLTGRRIEKITKAGIYIINGKKQLVK